jgi:alkylation response protein AidB-like acyl-CoA dehydrogenase
VHFGFDDDQLSARDTVAALLDKQCGLEAVQAVWRDGNAGSLRGLWRDLAGIGVQGLLAPETAGGSGLDESTLALVLAETGRAAVPLPLVETAAVGVPLVAAAGDPTGVLHGLVDGSLVLTVGAAAGDVAPAAGIADLFLLGGVLYGRHEVELEPVTSVDRTRDLARVRPTAAGVPIAAPDVAADRAALGAAAQLVGLGRELVRTTVEYVRDRRQFGVPVGSFQAVKHRLADAHLQLEFAAPAVWAAAYSMATGAADERRSVSLAKALASDAAYEAGRAALQCHGAMGYTDEYRLHYWMKRVWCLAFAYGSAAWHRDRIGKELGL